MDRAIELANISTGGPFGAVIVDEEGKVIGEGGKLRGTIPSGPGKFVDISPGDVNDEGAAKFSLSRSFCLCGMGLLNLAILFVYSCVIYIYYIVFYFI